MREKRRTGGVWSDERRAAQSERMKRRWAEGRMQRIFNVLHRGKFRKKK